MESSKSAKISIETLNRRAEKMHDGILCIEDAVTLMILNTPSYGAWLTR